MTAEKRKYLQVGLLWLLVCALVLVFNSKYLETGWDWQIPNYEWHDDLAIPPRGPLTPSALFTNWLPSTNAPFYRPTFFHWTMALYSLFGNWPPAFHAGSLVLHALCGGGAALLAIRLTRSQAAGFICAACMCGTDVYDQAIYWISSVSTLLAALFILGMAHSWTSWRATGRRRWYLLTIAYAGLAVVSKQDAALAPLLPLALDWVEGRFRVRQWAIYLPVLAAICLNVFAVRPESAPYVHVAGQFQDEVRTRLLQIPRYFDVCGFGFLDMHPVSIFNVLPTVITVTLFGGVLYHFRQHQTLRVALFGLFWGLIFTGVLAIVVGAHPESTRYYYLPTMGLALFVAALSVVCWRQGQVWRVLPLTMGIAAIIGHLLQYMEPIIVLFGASLPGLVALRLAWEKWLAWDVAVVPLAAGIASQLTVYYESNVLGLPLWWLLALGAVFAVSRKESRLALLTSTWVLLHFQFVAPVTNLILVVAMAADHLGWLDTLTVRLDRFFGAPPAPEPPFSPATPAT